jgi:amidase
MSLPSLSPDVSRRAFLGKLSGGVAGALASAIPLAVLQSAKGQMAPATSTDTSDEIIWMSATKLAQQIREKKVSATEAVKAYIERQETVNRRMNAVVMTCYDRALAEAKAADEALARGESKGPLHGVPITIKDSLDTEGVISTGGTIGRQTFVPDKDATVVARVRKAGAILLGKTNTPEFTLGGLAGLSTTSNDVYGSSRNPYDLTRSTSGSSGGAGANVAAGGAAFDIGSDWGGSIRGPAHNQGIVGIKPTSVRVPRTGHIVGYGGVFDLWQQLGPLVRRVEDTALITPIIAGPDYRDASCAPVPWADPAAVDLKKLKVAFFPTNGKTKTDDDTKAAVNAAAKWLEGNVADITEDLPTDILAELYEARGKLTSGDGWAFYQRLADKNHTKTFSPQVHDRLMKLTPVSTADYVAAWMLQDTNKARMLEWFSKYDVLLCPVAGEPAQPIDMGYDTPAYSMSSWSYTGAFNSTGWPVVVVRAGSSADGKLPIGIQVVANPWREDICIAVASFIESKSGGWKRPPI